MDLSHYKELYLKTSYEQLEKLHEGIDALSANTASLSGRDAVYLNAHTLVSKSMLMGYRDIGFVAQQIEKIFYNIKNNNGEISPLLIAVLKQSYSDLIAAFKSIEHNGSQVDLTSAKEALGKFLPERL